MESEDERLETGPECEGFTLEHIPSVPTIDQAWNVSWMMKWLMVAIENMLTIRSHLTFRCWHKTQAYLWMRPDDDPAITGILTGAIGLSGPYFGFGGQEMDVLLRQIATESEGQVGIFVSSAPTYEEFPPINNDFDFLAPCDDWMGVYQTEMM